MADGRTGADPVDGGRPAIISVRAEDQPLLLVLNNDHAAELSLLDGPGFARLIDTAFLALQTEDATALLIAFDQASDYDSPNFLWFRARFQRYVYVDRLVVSPAARGRGLARALYESLFAAASAAGIDRVVCEINVEPPNPGSIRFHEALGFRRIGDAALPGGAKRVAYYERTGACRADLRR
ncbi:GNAT family N-acetyltransferase [Aurantimonas sp. 22II-16-19i]|uniref:GNAT family N-acetyltransferase n=1 Tax=Aurantimonas sp. 22II-16-19i TaxID=1317114 RepID=UPI0009F7EAA9|nr:GNAT family N-acetyltransferase [Aurantimonas sp. 22II-16-19i]ORE89891.1 hypothetical protein ATO4_23217 [Aurantimonas sp. 22II-16-19i]